MSYSVSIWKFLLADRRLYLLIVLCCLGVLAAYQRSEPYRIELGTDRDHSLFEGLYGAERSASGSLRWTDARADVRFPNLWPSQPVRLTLRLSAPRPDTRATVPAQVIVNGRALATLDVGSAVTPYTFDLDADWLDASGNLYLTLQAPTFVPPND